MYRIDNATATGSLPAPGPVGPTVDGFFAPGVTTVDGDWLNAAQEEPCNFIEQAGLTLSKTDRTQLLKALGVLLATPGNFSKLSIVNNGANPTYQVDIDADMIGLLDSTNKPLTVTSVNLTVDITASGANGLDTGSEASSTWYYLWIISNGTTTAGLLSTSSSSPTMPGGYTYKRLVGAVRNDSGSDFVLFQQYDKEVVYEGQVVILDGAATSNAWTSLAAGSAYPPDICQKSRVACSGVGIQAFSHRSDGFGGSYYAVETITNTTLGGVFPTARDDHGTHEIMYDGTNIYYFFNETAASVIATGYTIDI